MGTFRNRLRYAAACGLLMATPSFAAGAGAAGPGSAALGAPGSTLGTTGIAREIAGTTNSANGLVGGLTPAENSMLMNFGASSGDNAVAPPSATMGAQAQADASAAIGRVGGSSTFPSGTPGAATVGLNSGTDSRLVSPPNPINPGTLAEKQAPRSP